MKRGVSLERALSKLGVASRSQARLAVIAGEVTVDDRTQTDPAFRLDLAKSKIAWRGVRLAKARRQCWMFHKPRGTLTTARDPRGRATVFDELPEELRGLHAVGRLDQATSGLLLLTNDSQLSNWLTDPQNAVERVYLLTVRGALPQTEADRWLSGVVDRGERLSAKAVMVRKVSARETHLVVTLVAGKNREIRRLCVASGHEPTRLVRVAYGGLNVQGLAPGQFRRLSDEELRKAFPGWQPRSPS
jgi:23S rRNA pseudouridine2605 synthase